MSGSANNDSADDVGVLFPDVELEVRDPDTGEDVLLTVREFRLLDGLKAQGEARNLIAELRALVVAGAEPSTEALMAAMAEHADEWLALLARATGRDVAWISRLPDVDGHALGQALWEANHPFFVSRMLAGVSLPIASAASGSRKSSATSSPPATGATSATSPHGSRSARSSSPGAERSGAGGGSPRPSS